ncbi:bactofilin family protein [Rubricoccus marinus]|uniref:Cell shape determination protein CcmA n=1 Tax=Rubricoccus marinus TaxID=716817 RepID=A0A259U3L3_9BACT|nr:polymer-forming cytoskeletal protein [Rubricoccus marinus]OZC04541.1 hypothetical protein BSZ36_02080 [Rubricoccus marinus]
MAKQRPVASVGPADQHNIIGAGSVVEGTLRGGGNVHIAGTINGNVEVEGRTVVMPGGVVDGELTSTSAEVGGHIKGQVTCRERLVLKPTAVVDGDIQTAKLVIEDGATFNGGCQMGAQAGASGADRKRRVIPAEQKEAA